MRTINKKELSRYNGLEGPVYVAYKDTVYDVSSSFLWKGGRHQVLHNAGEDLTDSLPDAPHGTDVLEKFPVAGILVRE